MWFIIARKDLILPNNSAVKLCETSFISAMGIILTKLKKIMFTHKIENINIKKGFVASSDWSHHYNMCCSLTYTRILKINL